MKKIERYLNQFPNCDGKTYIVTGANSGLGYAATKHFLSLGAKVIMACRNLDKAEAARQKLLNLYPHAKIVVLAYDQADFTAIDEFVEVIASSYRDFSGLILNAGIYHPRGGLVTKQGFPLTIGTNYTGVYYLLKKLQDAGLWKMAQARRIVLVGSLSWYRIKLKHMDDLLNSFRGSPTARYCRSKTALGALAYELSRHRQGGQLYVPKHIDVLIMHPGITSTNIVGSKSSSFPKWFSRLAHMALYVFVHKPEVAALSIIKLSLETTPNDDKISVPRGIFHLSGYPTLMPYPQNLKINIQPLLVMTEKVIAETIKESKNVRS